LLRQLSSIPSPVLGEDFGVVEVEAPKLAPEGGLLLELSYVSVDPYLRGSIPKTLKENDTVRGFVSGKVIESKTGEWKVGDLFGANLPFITIQTATSEEASSFRNLTQYLTESELSLGIGLLGMPGSTAYAALDLMSVNELDRVWISAATGAVGSVAGQIAKNVKHCKLVLGSAGSAEKCVTATKDFGFDACFNYRQATDASEMTALVKRYAPEGVDFYLENVGGDHFTAAFNNIREKGRIALCGAISKYSLEHKTGETIMMQEMIYKNIRIEGFLCTDWLSGKRGTFLKDMSKWHREGLVNSRETVFNGIEKWPEAFNALFQQGGENLGKIVVKV